VKLEHCLLNDFFTFRRVGLASRLRRRARWWGAPQPGRKPKNVTKDMNLQAVAREFGDIDREDYLRRVGNILFKEF